MTQLFVDNPWLALCGMIGVVIVASAMVALITDYLRKSHQADMDAWLKHEMLERGLSAEEIKTILEANSDGEAARIALAGHQGVRMGIGKLQFEVGALRKSASEAREAPAKC